MKQTSFKKTVSLLAAALMAVTALGGCGQTTATDDKGAEKKTKKIGVIQYVSHPSLDNCYEGIAAVLGQDETVTLERQIGSDASPDADCGSYAQNMVAAQYDMLIAIATPAASAAFAAAENTDIPVVFCAVNDPEKAELVQSNDAPGYRCTGTSDVLDLKSQLDLIQAMQPAAKKIGILYTTSEANSISNLETFKELAGARGLTVDAVGIQNDADIPSAATALASRVDCINNFTDNKVVNNLSVVLEAANTAGIPVYGSEVEQVKNGCLASMSIDYVALGKVTGEMAKEILGGADPAKMAVRRITEATPVVNTEVLGTLKMTMPAAYADAQTVTTNR